LAELLFQITQPFLTVLNQQLWEQKLAEVLGGKSEGKQVGDCGAQETFLLHNVYTSISSAIPNKLLNRS
jgi:hypothetical protein